jgi:Ser/Thr protein kinase RdoA (MazF antagonist)
MNQNSNIPDHITHILSNFCIEDTSLIQPYGSGHINDTYYVKSAKEGGVDYLLQKINHQIFKDVPGLMENIKLVTAHLKQKLAEIPSSNPDVEVLTLVPAKDNTFYYCDPSGNYWRVYHFLKTNSYDILQTEKQAFEGGRAFGKFQALLVDLDTSLIVETIPDFHHITKRLKRFQEAVQADVANRVKESMPEITFIQERMEEMSTALHSGSGGPLPLRIIHNDTKINNVLLDENDHAQCVIDLDTVMPGYVAYDFGDAIRTIINGAAEDEKDLDKIKLNIPLFKAYGEGYYEEAKVFLTDGEAKSLLTGAFLITYEQAVRFLTDYLEGDTYYKIQFPLHNLQRTRAQLELLRKMEVSRQTLKDIMDHLFVSV